MSQPASACNRLAAQNVERLVVGHVAVADDAVLSVARIGVECDIGEQSHVVPECLLQTSQSLAHEVVGFSASSANGVFLLGSVAGKIAIAGYRSTAWPTASTTASRE